LSKIEQGIIAFYSLGDFGLQAFAPMTMDGALPVLMG
jgi:hypothetical protein